MKSKIWKTGVVLAMAIMQALAVGAEGVKSFAFWKVNIICLQDAAMNHPQKLFTDTANTGYQQTEQAYESSVNVFAVCQESRVSLIDAGLDPMRGTLREKLRLAAINPEDVTDIFITHIHPDHVGGLLWEGKPLFPKATLHIAKEELDAWRQDGKRRSLAKYLEPYASRTDAFAFGRSLPGGFVPVKRAGHTPGHTIFRLPLHAGMEAIFVGDIVHAVALQFPHTTFCASYDSAPQKAVASRIETLILPGLLFGAHFPFPGVAKSKCVMGGNPQWSFEYLPYVETEQK